MAGSGSGGTARRACGDRAPRPGPSHGTRGPAAAVGRRAQTPASSPLWGPARCAAFNAATATPSDPRPPADTSAAASPTTPRHRLLQGRRSRRLPPEPGSGRLGHRPHTAPSRRPAGRAAFPVPVPVQLGAPSTACPKPLTPPPNVPQQTAPKCPAARLDPATPPEREVTKCGRRGDETRCRAGPVASWPDVAARQPGGGTGLRPACRRGPHHGLPDAGGFRTVQEICVNDPGPQGAIPSASAGAGHNSAGQPAVIDIALAAVLAATLAQGSWQWFATYIGVTLLAVVFAFYRLPSWTPGIRSP